MSKDAKINQKTKINQFFFDPVHFILFMLLMNFKEFVLPDFLV